MTLHADIIPLTSGADDGEAPREVTRDNIDRLERAILDQPQLIIEPVHRFADGLYAREITIPAGTVLTGKIHKFEHINIISKGDISVMTENGIERIRAPATIISKPGTKRVGYAHEDTVWTTVHACAETDIEKIEAALVVDTHEQFAALEESSTARAKLPWWRKIVCHS